MRSRPRRLSSDLPRPTMGQAGFLAWIIGVMSFLAALTLVAALALNELALRWQAGLSGSLTIEVPSSGREDEGQLRQRLDATIEFLKTAPGITHVRLLPPAEIEELVQPWLGTPKAGSFLPLPSIIEATIAVEARGGLPDLTKGLSALTPEAVLNDHGLFLSRLLHLAQLTRLVSFGLVGVIGITAVGAVAAAVKARFAALRGDVELLHTIGATDGYIARQFERQAVGVAGLGGISGALAAVGTIFLLSDAARALSNNTLLGNLRIEPADWAIVAAVPVLAVTIAVLSARWTVLRALRTLP